MRNNETGEFELVVGNRQLLSGFFIVVLLFAVVFAMGYIVGQNSPRSAKVAGRSAARCPPPPLTAVRQPAGPVPASQPPAEPPASDPAAADRLRSRRPARSRPPSAAREPQAPPGRLRPRRPLPPAAAACRPRRILLAGNGRRQPADAEVDCQNPHATKASRRILGPGPNNLVRVLVGPYSDVQAMGKAKTELENAGFLHPFRYQRDR